ncbi:MAG: non-canonical purine NTP diphosphatase [Bacteroidaceae bacterium]|nr:non-canonical purine NTP diphosphatase [Bacteroidaceae bacterium]
MKIVFATNNAHKLDEVSRMLGKNIELLSLSDIGCDEDIPETADTFSGNALMKARYVMEHYKIDCFADDTGLEVKSLGGAPGVLSARYAGNHDSEANMEKLLHELEGKNDRSAQFCTVIALLINGEEHLFEGIVTGHIAESRQGTGGFGYDPIFIPDGYSESFAQLDIDEKNCISHRGRAVRKLVDYLNTLQ